MYMTTNQLHYVHERLKINIWGILPSKINKGAQVRRGGAFLTFSLSALALTSHSMLISSEVWVKRSCTTHYQKEFATYVPEFMVDTTYAEPLLSGGEKFSTKKKTIQWIIKTVMWAIFITWIIFIFVYPIDSVNALFQDWFIVTSTTVLGIGGPNLIVFSSPVVIIALLSLPLLLVSKNEDDIIKEKMGGNNRAKWRLSTFPMVVGGPLGVVSAAELLGIIAFLIYLIWTFTLCLIQSLYTDEVSTYLVFYDIGTSFGIMGIFCTSFLFLPIARGSLLLQLINVPFEHASKYHIWLGHLIMSLLTLHAISYMISWKMEQESIIKEILRWQGSGPAYFPGAIAYIAGVLLWVTALGPVRKWSFELFYYTHHLYIIFFIFMSFHIGWKYFSVVAGGMFLFFLDRFIRFCQSRTTVKVISATSFPSGVIKLVLLKPINLHYNALSFIFLRIREASWLQWHPFSISSSPEDNRYSLSLHIKGVGGWTADVLQNPTTLTVSVEGPYGPEPSYHLLYEKLVFVAGGIGITPFLAILSDILHRVRQEKPCLTKRVMLVWSVKKSREIVILSNLDVNSICPDFSSKIDLQILIHVTRETEPQILPLEQGGFEEDINFFIPESSGSTMSTLVGTGDKLWVGLYVFIATVGFVMLHTMLYELYVEPFSISVSWYLGFLLLVCVAASVVIFGGIVLVFWHFCGNKTTVDSSADVFPKVSGKCFFTLGSLSKISYGSRPDLKGVFGDVGKNWGEIDVGVIVCGPPELNLSVAGECRSSNLRRKSHQPILHFNSISYDI